MVDACIKRIKSVFLATLVLLLIALGLAYSRLGLQKSYDEMRHWYAAWIALTAQTPTLASLTTIDDVAEDTWRLSHERPTQGPFLDVVRDLADHAVARGRIAIPGAPILDFVAKTYRVPSAAAPKACRGQTGVSVSACIELDVVSPIVGATSLTFLYNASSEAAKRWTLADEDTSATLDLEQVAEKVKGIAEQRSMSAKDPSEAYQFVDKEWRSQTVKLPVVDVEVPARFSGLALAVFAVVSAYLTAHSFSILRYSLDDGGTEPWVLTKHSFARPFWMSGVEVALFALSRVAAYAQIWVPFGVVFLSIYFSGSSWNVALNTALAAIVLLLALYSTRSLAGLLTHLDKPPDDSG